MVGVVGYFFLIVSLVLRGKPLVSYLEEDRLALRSLHHPSPVHVKHTEVVDRDEPVVVWGPGTVERQRVVIGWCVKTYPVVYHRTLASPYPSLSVHASQDKP